MKLNLVVRRTTLVQEGETIEEILKKCGYTIESVILLKDGRAVLEEDIADDDTVEVMPVASGG